MTQNDDLKAIARILALTFTKNYDEAERVLAWAYEKDRKEEEEARTLMNDNVARVAVPPVEYGEILNLWNVTMARCIPKVRDLSGKRKENVKRRVFEMGGWPNALKQMGECFRKLNDSDFCNGKTGWTASFDWFFANGTNWRKVLEGNYDNRREKTQLDALSENIAMADAYYEQRFGNPGAGANGNPAGSREDGPDEQ